MASPFRPEDDDRTSIPDDAVLYRRVDWDRIGGRASWAPGQEAQLNGNCFTDYPETKAMELGYPGACMSMGVDLFLIENGKKPADMLDGYEGYGLAKVEAGALRALRKADGSPCPQGVKWSATDLEPWHCVVFDLSGKRTSAVQKAIVRVASWEIPLIGTDAN